MSSTNLATCIVCHDDYHYLAETIASFRAAGPVVTVISRLGWDGSASEGWQKSVEIAEGAQSTVIVGDYPSESLHRKAALREMVRRGFRYCFIPDSDEIIPSDLLQTLVGIAQVGIASRVHVHMDTYFKSTEYVVRPREALTPVILIDLEVVKHSRIREYSGGTKLVLTPEFGVLAHLSYCCPLTEDGAGLDDTRILRKISTWGHRHEIPEDWYGRVFRGWDADPTMRNLHPTHPQAYHKIERIKPPDLLWNIPIRLRGEIIPNVPWPKISIVIPLYGGHDDIRRCLESLDKLKDLLHEVIVVDDKSPDGAASVVNSFEDVKLIHNEKNVGFAATCNIGYRVSSGEVILFLNSDTVVPRHGLIRLIESLMSSHNVAAAGPYSNNTGHHQQIASTYESLETMPLFAEDLAEADFADEDVDMLVGFCLAIKRHVLEEVGVFDERFGTGMFEDNDICYRMRRAGFRLVLSRKAFVHHEGSKSLSRRKEHPAVLLARNQAVYFKKWKDDLECGFASHLSGTSSGPITFDPKNKPEEIDKRIRKLAKQANICLCMIVKNEARVLRDCLSSIVNGITQLVIVDTGSADETMEIAREFGAELYQMKWPNSFSEARNYSLKFAKRPFIMWMDADDTIDRRSLELILLAVIQTGKKWGGFVVPIRFVDEGPYGGMQVDHVKIFQPGSKFEGRIHEQVLPSIRATGKDVVRINGAVIRHSGYDTSEAGQKIKREREEVLLILDHEEDPNHPFKMFNPGMTFHYRMQHELAIEWLDKCIAASVDGESHLRKAYALKGVSQRELGDVEGALATFDAGLAVAPEDPELLFQSAVIFSDLGRLQEAKDRYLRISTDTSEHFSSVDIGILTFKRYHNLGTVDMALGNYAEAKKWWQLAISTAPTFSPSAVELFEAAMKHEDFRTAREALDALRGAEGPSEGWALRTCRMSSESGVDPEQTLRSILQAMPYAIGPLLVLGRTLVERGNHLGAVPILSELERLGCAEGAFLLGLMALQGANLWAALTHMSLAHEMNTNHEPTTTHLAEIRRILSNQIPAVLKTSGSAALVGPHAGKLNPATCRASVVVVTYNSVDTITQCVECLLATFGDDDELILVDNCSSDGTPHLLKSLAEGESRIKLILQESNLGYSRAANLGMLASSGEFVVPVNPDAYVNPGWVETLSAYLVDGVAAVGPMSDNTGGDQFVGHILRGRHPSVADLPAILAHENAGKTLETKFLVGICVMVKRETLNQHGLLDETTELGADDLEYSWRMRSLGLKLLVAQDVFVQHERGVSFASLPSNERVNRQARSDMALFRKLQAYYGEESIPSSMELWGTPIFDEAFERARMLLGEPVYA